MNNNNLISKFIQTLQKDLAAIFRKYPAVESAYLFGSTAQRVDRKLSDVDIAARLIDSLTPESAFDIRMKLMDELEHYFGRKVDVVLLNTASLKLIHQVLRFGEIIFAKDLGIEMDYAIKKYREYFDFKYYIDKDIQESRKYFRGDHT